MSDFTPPDRTPPDRTPPDRTPPRIFLVDSVGVIGGAERVVCACARSVKTAWPGASVHVLLMSEGPLRAALEAEGATVHVVPMPDALASAGDSRLRGAPFWARVRAWVGLASRLRTARAYTWQLKSAVDAVKPTLVHAHGFKSLFLLSGAVAKDVPLVWHVHDFTSDRPLVARLVRRAARRVTRAIAVSDAVRRDLERVAPGLPVTVVHNGVDLTRFSPAPRDGSDLDRRTGLASDAGACVRVGLVATYADWKGHEAFLYAIARCGPLVRGFVIGGPIYATAGSQVTLDQLKRLVAHLGIEGRVGFLPFDPDPADVYRMLDVVVHASTRPEPFGLTIAEAMACGRAIVVSAAGGALEVFEEGVSAIGHAPGDVAGLAAAIERLAADPDLRTRLGHSARAAAEARFGSERFANELLAVYATAAQMFA